jgi:hypothetical protein
MKGPHYISIYQVNEAHLCSVNSVKGIKYLQGIDLHSLQISKSQVLVAHTYNLSYSGRRDQDSHSKPAPGK